MSEENQLGGSVGLDTTAFKKGVSELNSQIRAIESSFRASAAVMDNWSQTSDGLNQRTMSLSEKLELQKKKLEILRKEYEALRSAEGDHTREMEITANAMYSAERAIQSTRDALNNYQNQLGQLESPTRGLSDALGTLERNIAVSESGFRAASSSMDDWRTTSEGLGAKIKSLNEVLGSQGEKLRALKEAREKAIALEGEDSRAAQELTTRINNEQAAYNTTERDIRRYTEQLDNLAHAQNNAERSTGSLTERLKSSVGKLGSGLATGLKVAGTAVAGVGVAAAGAAVGVYKLAESASDLNEAQNVVDQTFKKTNKSVLAWTNTTAMSAGIGKTAATQMVGTMGAMLKSSGMTEQAAGKTSEGLVQLTGDLSSFYNISTSEMWEKMRAGMAGETKPLKDLGINMSVANLSAFALKEGITKSYKSMSQAEQTTLRYNYLLSVTKDAQGDFARTSGSMANQQRILQMQIAGLGQTIGSMALPMINKLLKSVNGIVSALSKALSSGKGFDQLGTVIGQALGKAIGQITSALPNFTAAATKILTQVIGSLVKAIPQILPTLTTGVVQLINAAVTILQNNGPMLIRAAVMAVTTIVNGLISALPQLLQAGMSMVTSLVDAVSAQLPTLIPLAVKCVMTLAEGIASNIPMIIKSGLKLVTGLVQGLMKAVPQLLKEAPKLVVNLINGIVESLPMIINAAPKIIISLIEGIIKSIPILIEDAPKIIIALIKGIIESLPMLLAMGPKINDELAKGLMKQDWPKIGINILKGIVDGWNNLNNWIWKKVQEAGNSIVNSFKSFFGIHSPSALMRDKVGYYIGTGIAEGIDKATVETAGKSAEKYMQAISDGITANITKAENAAQKAGASVSKAYAAAVNASARKVAAPFRGAGVSDLTEEIKKLSVTTSDYTQRAVNLTAALALSRQKAAALTQTYAKLRAQYGAAGTVKDDYSAKIAALRAEITHLSTLSSLTTDAGAKSTYKARAVALREQIAQLERLKAAQTVQNKATKEGVKEMEAAKKALDAQSVATEQLKAKLEATYQSVETKSTALYSKLEKAADTYEKNVKTRLAKLKTDIQSVVDDYNKQLSDLKSSIYGSTGLFSAVSESDSGISADTLTQNLQGQVDQLKNWQAQIAALKAKGIPPALLSELEAMGPSASPDLAALNSMTAAQLQQYETLWSQKNSLAQSAAVSELESVKQKSLKKIKELQQGAAKDLAGYAAVWKSTSSGISKQMKTLAGDMKTYGKDMMKGLAEGINAEIGSVSRAVDAVTKAISKKLHMNGIAEGINANRYKIAAAVQGISTDLSVGIRTAPGAGAAMQHNTTYNQISPPTIIIPVYVEGKLAQTKTVTSEQMRTAALNRAAALGVKIEI